MPKLHVVLFVKDFEIKIQHLTVHGEPGLSRIPMPMRSYAHAIPHATTSSSSEGQPIPKSTKKILANFLMSLQDVDISD